MDSNISSVESTSSPNVFYGVNFNPDAKTYTYFTAEQLEVMRAQENTFCWIDLQSPNIDDLYSILKRLGNDLTLESHFAEPEILPRIMERTDSLVFFLYEIVDPEKYLDTRHDLMTIEFARMVVILSNNYILTYHKEPLDAVDYVKANAIENFKLAGKTAGFIIFLFLQRCLYDYSHLNLANDNYLDQLELSVLSGQPEELAKKISIAGLNILILKKLSANLHIILMLLVTKINPFVSHAARDYFREMLQNAIATRAAIDSSRDSLDGIIAGVQANASSRTREIARVLTIVSVIFLPLTLLSGIYGMNFHYIPGLAASYGFYLTIIGMVLLTVIFMMIFYFLGWVGSFHVEKTKKPQNPK